MKSKERIINSVIPLLIENGITGTSTKMILERAKVTNGTLFNYFPNKDILVKEVYIYCKLDLLDANYTAIKETVNTKEIVHKYFLSIVNWALNNKDKKLFISMYQNQPYIRNCNVLEDDKRHNYVIQKLEEIINSDIISTWDLASFLFGIFAYTDSVINYISICEPNLVDEYIQFSFDRYWRSIVNI